MVCIKYSMSCNMLFGLYTSFCTSFQVLLNRFWLSSSCIIVHLHVSLPPVVNNQTSNNTHKRNTVDGRKLYHRQSQTQAWSTSLRLLKHQYLVVKNEETTQKGIEIGRQKGQYE